jgi:TolA-binding protein
MKDAAFLVYCQSLILVIALSYGAFKVHFAQDGESQLKVVRLEGDLKAERLKTDLALEDLQEFETYVALYLPEALQKRGKKAVGYGVRNLASVTVDSPGEKLRESLGLATFERGKEFYRTGDYANAKTIFINFINQHPFAVNIVEANFLLMDSLSHLGQDEESVKIIRKMVQHYPESELTGFALIKLGDYLQSQGHKIEAIQVYKTVLQTMPFRDVSQAAAHSLRSMEL